MTTLDYGVITMVTQFEEYSKAFTVAGAKMNLVIAKHLAWVAYAAEEIGVPILQDFTPVDTGRLRESTEAHVWADVGLGGPQVTIKFEQPARNNAGVEYAPYVILGHATRNPEVRVQPNPYNKSAAEEMLPPMNEVIWLAGRRIAEETVMLMRVA